MGIFTYILFSLLIIVGLFFPGLVFLSGKRSRLGSDEKLALSPVFSIVFLGLLSIVVYFSPLPVKFGFRFFSFLWFGLAVYLFLKNRLKKRVLTIFKKERFGILLFLLLVVGNITYSFLPVDFTKGKIGKYPPHAQGMYAGTQLLAGDLPGDNYLPYRIAQFVINKLPAKTYQFYGTAAAFINSRTPLSGLVSAAFLVDVGAEVPDYYLWHPDYYPLDNNSYELFGCIHIILNSIFVFSLSLFLRKIFKNRKVVELGLLFMVLNPYLNTHVFYTWPKLFMGYVVFLFFYGVLKGWGWKGIGALMALSYWIHPSAMLYIPGAFIYIFLRDSVKLSTIRNCFRVGIPFLLLIAPWQWWINTLPFDSMGMIKAHFISKENTVLHLLGVRLVMFLRTTMPVMVASEAIVKWPGFLKQLSKNASFSLAGAISLSLFLWAYYSLVRYFSKFKKEILSFFVVPVVMLLFINGIFHAGLAHLSCQPLVAMLVGMAVWAVVKTKSKLVSYLVLGAVVVEYYVLEWFSRRDISFLFKQMADSNWQTTFLLNQAVVVIVVLLILRRLKER